MRKWLKDIRKDKGLTQEQVASEIYINRSYYTQIENGTRNPSIHVAKKIADLLGFNPSSFFVMDLYDPFEVSLANSPIIVAHCDLELRYTWIFNPYPDFDYSKILGKRDDELALNSGTINLMNLKKEVIRNQEKVRREISFPLSDGVRIYDVYAKPLFDRTGKVIGAVTASTDITRYMKK